jgi:hypothetical protein
MAVRQFKVFHGTSAHYLESILKHGLLSFRKSKGVYFTPSPDKAMGYAKVWAVGLHATGIAQKPEAVIIGFDIAENARVRAVQIGELSIGRTIPASKIRVESRTDLSDMDEQERVGCLFKFLGVAGWRQDPHVGIDFREATEKAKRILDGYPDEYKQECFQKAPMM